MSKKTRKKSSKGSAKTPAKTPAKSSAKTPAKKSAQKTIPAKAARSGSKAPVKTPAAKAGKAVATEIRQSGQKRFDQRIPQAGVEIVKIQAIGGAESRIRRRFPSRPRSRTAKARPRSRVGLKAPKRPSFRLPRDGGDSVSLADYAGQKLVLFFYPRADTPGCTREAIDFTRLKDAFAESGTAVLGISADTVKAQESFREQAPALDSSDFG